MTSRASVTRSFTVFLALLLCSCQSQPPEPIAADDYFPLARGHYWHYQTRTSRGDATSFGDYRVENLGEVEREQERYRARRNSHGTEYLFRQDEQGIYRAGIKTITSSHVKHDPRKRYVLKTPLRTNEFWFNDSHAFVIERSQPLRERFWNTHPFEMEYQVTALDETVQVPAGVYEHCVRVEATGTVELLADVTQGRYGSSEGEIRTTEWYAPGIGLVKVLRQERFQNSLFVDGSFLIELTSSSAEQ